MDRAELPVKVRAVYQAVMELFVEGADLRSITVSEIARKAGIGKGTVYEYFSNKDELIAGALFYELKSACGKLYESLEKEKDLYAKVDRILINMEKKLTEANCILRAVQIMMDHSSISLKLRKMAEDKGEGDMLFLDLLRRILEEETKAGENISGNDMDCLVMMVFARIISYALYQLDGRNMIRLDGSSVRQMICREVCRDTERARLGKYAEV